MITLSLSEARERLAEVVDSVALAGDRVTITRDGRAVAVVISPDDLEALEETLAWMSHDGMAAYRESREQFTVGDTIDLEALRSERETKDASLLAPGSTSTHKPSSR